MNLQIKWNSPNHNNLDYATDITILKDGINYFANKKALRKEDKRRFVESNLAVIISLIALLKSFDSEIIWLWKQLMKLLK